MLQLSNIKIKENLNDEQILKFALKKFNIQKEDILEWYISKKSIDARNKNDVHYNYSLNIKVKNENKYPKITKIKKQELPPIKITCNKSTNPVIVGCGPSGIFAALTLVENGLKPIIIEQGQDVDSRQKSVEHFLKTGDLNTYSNVQFGEGGAGTFSDGKLTTGINSPFCKNVLETFVKFGAPQQILYLSKPHIGTDNLIKILKNMREYIILKGGKFLFEHKVIDFNIVNNKITSIKYINLQNTSLTQNEIKTNFVILAIGHSARETFEKLYEKGFNMEKKNFSVGVRIEHLQKTINNSQYGTSTKLKLPPAEYKLAYHSPSGRSCYTFCMCPGGTVMASSSEPNTIVTNGMSRFSRDGENANSAILVNVTPEDFNEASPLAGLNFQKDLENKAFILGGSNYNAPIQRTEDFINNRKSTYIGKIKPSYKPGVTLTNLQEILPDYVTQTLKEGIQSFDTKLHGFADPDSILTGVETRSSSPIRILRDEHFVSNIEGVYPCGEGAGYAGGIMSAAVDGIKCARALLSSS